MFPFGYHMLECICRNRASGCAMLPAATPALYGGCAFSDAAAMSATVTRLEAELAHAKASLSDRMASEEGLARQRRALEADVARLHAEVAAVAICIAKEYANAACMTYCLLLLAHLGGNFTTVRQLHNY